MTGLAEAVEAMIRAQIGTGKPLAVVVAGHNGSGKSTMWRDSVARMLRIPLVNADRMMLSILPEAGPDGHLVPWAAALRDRDRGWMGVAQQGVEAFVGHAMRANVPFAVETVFSYWEPRPDGTIASKIDRIRDMQKAGYFVLLFFVGLANADLSILRVKTRVLGGGHGVDEPTLRRRFPKTQRAIFEAIKVVDASILTDNSRAVAEAFTVCLVRLGARLVYDIRDGAAAPGVIADWLRAVDPR
jgi:predicted ABC-type ATPase